MPQYIDLLNRIAESHDGDDYFDPEVLAQAARQNDKSRQILIHMAPEDFLKVAGRGLDASKTARVGGLISQGVKFNEIPWLAFVHDGEGMAVVADHNGRHRARELMARGVKNMPVVVASQSGGGGQSLRWGSLDHEYDGYTGEWPHTLRGQKGDDPGHEHNTVGFPVPDTRKRNLTELFDSPQAWRWNETGMGSYAEAVFTIEGVEYQIDFARALSSTGEIWIANLEIVGMGDMGVHPQNNGLARPVYSTCIEIFLAFIAKYDPHAIVLTGVTTKQQTVYRMIARSLLRDYPEWKMSEEQGSVVLRRTKSLTEAQFRKPEVMYHGTSSSLVRSIMKEGVVPFPKHRVWDQDPDTTSSVVSRKSIGGSYWTNNLMTATSSARNARRKLGGANSLIVVAQIQQQSAFSDEDNINSPLSWALMDVARAFGVNDVVHISYLFRTPGYEAKRDYAIELFREKLAKGLRSTYQIPREQAEAIILAAIRRAVAHEFRHDVQNGGYISSSALERFGLQSRDDIPDVEQAENDYLKAREALTRTFRVGAYNSEDSFNATLRIETPVGFSGANKILAIIETVEYPYGSYEEPDRDHFILHYGTIPDDFRKQWQNRVGPMRPVYSPDGKLLEP